MVRLRQVGDLPRIGVAEPKAQIGRGHLNSGRPKRIRSQGEGNDQSGQP
jgi:hypothetical protein